MPEPTSPRHSAGSMKPSANWPLRRRALRDRGTWLCLRIVLVGFGNVGREFARMLLERKSELAKVPDRRADVVAILTGRHGSVERAGGIELRRALRLADAGVSLENCGRAVHGSSVDYLHRVRADVVIEISPLRIARRQIAVEHFVTTLTRGKAVMCVKT